VLIRSHRAALVCTLHDMHLAFYRTVVGQGGVFTTEQARDDHSELEIRRHLRAGRWRRTPWRGVLVDADLPDHPAVLVRAAALLLGGDLVACRTTAALLHGFDLGLPGPVHFLGPARVRDTRRPGIDVHPSHLGTDDAVLVAGVWCTPAARTACEVVRTSRTVDGLATLDLALRVAACTADELAAAEHAQEGQRGVLHLRRVLPLASPLPESPMESRARWRYVEGGLPAPTPQVPVGRRFLDLGWDGERVGGEYDGLEAHMTREQLRADRARHNEVTAEGWTLLHLTDHDVFRAPQQMVRAAARALRIPDPPRLRHLRPAPPIRQAPIGPTTVRRPTRR
jgi:very-short-patch-repair endonuclease